MNKYDGAIIVMDCWDNHWDIETNKISNILNPVINNYLNSKRGKYMIIHCPNDCYNYYKNHPKFLKDIDFPKTYKYVPDSYIISKLKIFHMYLEIQIMYQIIYGKLSKVIIF